MGQHATDFSAGGDALSPTFGSERVATLSSTKEVEMSQVAAEKTTPRCVPTATQAPGSSFFGLMAGLWGAFVALLAVSPATLDDAYDWLRGLAVVWEVLLWIVTLPWTLAYLAYDSSWEHWLRVLVVALIVVVHLGISAPKLQK
jgi:hypothetical protein